MSLTQNFWQNLLKTIVQLILADLKEVLCKEFDGLKISISALQRHLVQKCRITLKKLEKIPAARCSDRVVALRKSKVEQWQQIPEISQIIVSLSTKLVLTCTFSEIEVVLKRDNQQKELFQPEEVLCFVYCLGSHFARRYYWHYSKKISSSFRLQEKKNWWQRRRKMIALEQEQRTICNIFLMSWIHWIRTTWRVTTL